MNLVLLDGSKWKTARNMLSPCFTSDKMKILFSKVVGVGKRFRARVLELIKDTDELDMSDLAARYLNDVLAAAVFGIESNSLNDSNDEFWRLGRPPAFKDPIFFQVIFNRLHRVARMIGLKVVPTEVAEFFMRIVKDAVDYRKQNNIRCNDFVDSMINLKKQKHSANTGFTLNEIAAHSAVFSVAGFDSSFRLVLHTLYELALHTDIQARVRDEIKNVLDAHGGELTYEATLELKYLQQVLHGKLFVYGFFTK